MRLYVLTRSAYGPAWPLEANHRRLEVTAAVTARLMAAQTDRDWTWVVLVDERDPLRAEREAVFAAAAPRAVFRPWSPPSVPRPAAWDRHGSGTNERQRIAAEAYRAAWDIGPRDGTVVQVRLDDDDGLAPTALARYRSAVRPGRRMILMLPRGVRVWKGRYDDVTHRRNAMHALVTPKGDTGTVYDYPHAKCDSDPRAKGARLVMVDDAWGWLWVRHRDTISGWRRANHAVDRRVRSTFPVDWAVLAAAWSGAS